MFLKRIIRIFNLHIWFRKNTKSHKVSNGQHVLTHLLLVYVPLGLFRQKIFVPDDFMFFVRSAKMFWFIMQQEYKSSTH